MGTTIRQSNFQFNLNFNIFGTASSASQAISTLNQFQYAQQDTLLRGYGGSHGQVPYCGCLPPPHISQSGPPAGRGLKTNEQGWPEGTVTTAGGYHVVPEGNTNWSIYSPGQKHGEKANTRVWGDPHVTEKDGTRWDFTKSSDFVLGDGTRIAARTSSDTGQSVTTGLDITNGADRVTVDNINGKPSTSAVKHDGYEWRAAHVASNPNRDTFHLRGDSENVHWVRERNGQLDGVVTGAHYDKANNRYEQNVDASQNPGLGRDLRPPFGSRAWGNQLRSQLDDAQAKMWGQALGPLGQYPAVLNALGIHSDHLQARLFGGWPSYFGTANDGFSALGMLRDLLTSDAQWRHQLQFGNYSAVLT